MLDPYTLTQAVDKARHQEKILESNSKRNRVTGDKSATPAGSLHQQNPKGSTGFNKDNQGASGPGSSSLRENRRLQGLCYECGDKYVYGHQCKSK